MRWFRFASLILVVTLLQASMVDMLALANVKPDLLLVLLVFFAIYCDTPHAVITSFVIGFAADIIGPTMGPQMVSFGILGTLLAYLHRVIAIRTMPYQSLAISVVGLTTSILALFLTFFKGQHTMPDIYTALLGTSLYSGIIGPFLYLPLAWWMRMRLGQLTGH